VLVLLSIIDVEERRLPNVIVLPSFVLVLTAHLVLYPSGRRSGPSRPSAPRCSSSSRRC
jgi:hypothetical protein